MTERDGRKFANCSRCRAEYNVSALEEIGVNWRCPICRGERQYKTIDALSKQTREDNERRRAWR